MIWPIDVFAAVFDALESDEPTEHDARVLAAHPELAAFLRELRGERDA